MQRCVEEGLYTGSIGICFPSPLPFPRPFFSPPPPPLDTVSKMASGVKVSEEVKIKYEDIKKKKTYRYLVFHIKDEKIISERSFSLYCSTCFEGGIFLLCQKSAGSSYL